MLFGDLEINLKKKLLSEKSMFSLACPVLFMGLFVYSVYYWQVSLCGSHWLPTHNPLDLASGVPGLQAQAPTSAMRPPQLLPWLRGHIPLESSLCSDPISPCACMDLPLLAVELSYGGSDPFPRCEINNVLSGWMLPSSWNQVSGIFNSKEVPL